VETKTNVIVNMLEDAQLNVEALGEHKAVMDHVMDSVHRLGQMLQEAQSTMRALQAERDVAGRIQTGIRKVRTKSARSAGL
jgi:hypothetical protein